MRRNRLVPWLGVVALLLIIASFIVATEPPDPGDESVQELIDFYTDNETAQMIGAMLGLLAAAALLVFNSYLRSLFRRVEGEGGVFSNLILIGMTIIAVGIAIDATITATLVDAASEDADPSTFEALGFLWQNDYMPFALGNLVWLIGLGVSILKYGLFPKWLGWVAILLAVIAVTPIGFASFIAGGLLNVVLSVWLGLRERKGTGAVPPPAQPTMPA